MVSSVWRAVGFGLALVFAVHAGAAEPERVDLKITSHLGDRQVFAEGDNVSFFLTLERDAYIYLFYRDAEANLLQLLPNKQMPGHFYAKGMFMPIPSEQQPFLFTVVPPFGDELIFAVASDKATIELPGLPLGSGLILIEGTIEQVEDAILAQSERLFGRAELHLKTTPQN